MGSFYKLHSAKSYLGLFSLLFLGFSSSAHAIPLEATTFDSNARIEVQGGTNPELTNSILIQGNSLPGGTVSSELTLTGNSFFSGGPNGTVNNIFDADLNVISHNSSLTGSATTLLTYDGDTTIGLSSFDKLDLDLTAGSAENLLFDVWYDYPFPNSPGGGRPMELEFTFYDKSDTTGNTFSKGLFSVDQRYDDANFTTLSLAFSAFSVFGTNGAADLSNIGAFTILFDGSEAPAADFGLKGFRTDGTAAVPEPATVLLLGSGVIGARLRRKKA